MKRVLALILTAVLTVSFSSCAGYSQEAEFVPNQNEAAQTDEMSAIPSTKSETEEQSMSEYYTVKTKINDVINDPIPCMEQVRQFPIIRRL